MGFYRATDGCLQQELCRCSERQLGFFGNRKKAGQVQQSNIMLIFFLFLEHMTMQSKMICGTFWLELPIRIWHFPMMSLLRPSWIPGHYRWDTLLSRSPEVLMGHQQQSHRYSHLNDYGVNERHSIIYLLVCRGNIIIMISVSGLFND